MVIGLELHSGGSKLLVTAPFVGWVLLLLCVCYHCVLKELPRATLIPPQLTRQKLQNSKGYAKSPEFSPALGLIIFGKKSVATNLR